MSHQDARDAVRDELARQGKGPNQLAQTAGVDPATVRDFLSGARWPRPQTLARLDAALSWEPGTIDRIVRGAAGTTVSDPVHTGGVLLDMDESAYADLEPSEREEAIAAAKLAFTRTAREIRRAREG